MKVNELLKIIRNDKETVIIIYDKAGNVLIIGKLDEVISQIKRDYFYEEIFKFFISFTLNALTITLYKEFTNENT